MNTVVHVFSVKNKDATRTTFDVVKVALGLTLNIFLKMFCILLWCFHFQL